MNVKCILTKGYKLTEGKIYQVGEETRDFYKLFNDNNVGVQYSKSLFEVVPNDVEQTRPIVPPAPPRRTEADLVRSISINNDDQVTFRNFNNELVIINDEFEEIETSISCGIHEYNGLNAQINEIDFKFDLEEDDFITIRKALFKKCIQQYAVNNATGAFALFSTNVTGEDNGNQPDEDLLTVLDELSITSTAPVRNPNSGNNIKLWIIQRQ